MVWKLTAILLLTGSSHLNYEKPKVEFPDAISCYKTLNDILHNKSWKVIDAWCSQSPPEGPEEVVEDPAISTHEKR